MASILRRSKPKRSNKYSVNKLNDGQKDIYNRIIQEFAEDFDGTELELITSKVLTLDAPPGTGKTFLITTLVHNINLSHNVIVYRNSLVNDYTAKKVKGQTVFRFLNGIFHFCGYSIFEACDALFEDQASLEQSLLRAYRNIMKIQINADILILDEYTVISPWLLLCLVQAAKRLGKHIIITGDGDQLNSMKPSKYHEQTNRSLAEAISNQCFVLQQQMRISDPVFNKIIADMKETFHKTRETDLTFDIAYFLYENLKKKFFKDDLEALYISAHHVQLKKRQEEIIRLWEKEKRPIHYEYFMFSDMDEVKEMHFKGKHEKFSTNLPLVEGKIYLLDNQYLVRLESIDTDSLDVSYCDTGEWLTIERRNVSQCGHNVELVEYLNAECHKAGYSSVRCYPLRLTVSTYHSIQGTTIRDMKIVLNLDEVNANGVYVGLSRLPSADLLAGIQSSLLPSFIYTELQNDDYYYKINGIKLKPNQSKEAILKQLSNITISDIPEFNDIHKFKKEKEINCRILKSDLKKKDMSYPLTGIIKVSKFLTTHAFLLQRSYDDEELLVYFEEYTRKVDQEQQQQKSVDEPKRKRLKM